jgi:structural maintenance of chromosome 2
VVVGGKNKYLVNGHTTQQNVIQNLFQSVQLNVNNPHFLIMQGKITKVLNMKPIEVLSMVEEAAGTRMFEERKDKAQKAIAKKEKKLEEIQSLLNEEIIPKLDKLRSERTSFLEFQKLQQEKERLERQVVQFEETYLINLIESAEGEYAEMNQAIQRLQSTISMNLKDFKLAVKEEEQLLLVVTNAEHQALEKKHSGLKGDLARLETQLSIKKKSLEEERQSMNRLLESKESLSESIRKLKESKLSRERDLSNLIAIYEDKARDVERLQALVVSFSLDGEKDSAEAAANSFAQQLIEERSLLTKVQTERENLQTRALNLQMELKKLEPELNEGSIRRAQQLSEIERVRNEMKKSEERLKFIQGKLDFERLESLNLKRKQIRENVYSLKEVCKLFHIQLWNWGTTVLTAIIAQERENLFAEVGSYLTFDYASPTSDFDRSAVKGTIASLISLDRKDFEKSMALELTAGGALHHVCCFNNIFTVAILNLF